MAEQEKLPEEEQWEERALCLLDDYEIDQQFLEAKYRKKLCRKQKLKWMKNPMAIPKLILALQDNTHRERALMGLTYYLFEVMKEEPDSYHRTGIMLSNSCCTMTILLQEVLAFLGHMVNEDINSRSSKRITNVLTIFQCIAANAETREKFVTARVPDFLIPMIVFKSSLEEFENVRAVALSVIGILCQTREPQIIFWAIESNIVEICQISIDIGSELSKVIGMHILEAILRDRSGLSHVCETCSLLVGQLMTTFANLVNLLSARQDFSPRLLFHIIRCYILLCNHMKGYAFVWLTLPQPIVNGSFQDIIEEFPLIGSLLQQLLLLTRKVNDIPQLSP